MSDQRDFRKEIRLLDGVMLVAGTMIGSGIFIVSADIARNVGSAGLLLLVWGLSGFLTVIGALSFGELTSMFPKAGGQYIFLREAYNPLVAFLYGWTLFLVIQTGTAAAVAVAFAKFTGVFFPWFSPENVVADFGFIKISTQQLLAIAVILLLSYINVLGVRNGKIIQTFFGSTKILALFALIAIGIFIHNEVAVSQNFGVHTWDAKKAIMDHGVLTDRQPLFGWALIVAIVSAMVGSLFSMDAWNNITFAGDEVVNPKRTIPLSMAIGTILVTVIYLLVNTVYLTNLPLEGKPDGLVDFSRGIQFATNDRVAAAVADVMSGHHGVEIIAALIMLSTFSCLNGILLSGARVYFKMAEDGLFFRSMSRLNTKGVPAGALIFQAIWASLLCLSGTYGQLLDYVIFSVLLFYLLAIIGIFILRKKQPDHERTYKAFGYPFLPLLYIIAVSLICTILIIYKTSTAGWGLVLVLAGIPVYYIFRSTGKKTTSS